MKTIEKIIQSSTAPLRQDVIWIDTSDPNNPVVKIYVNGNWELAPSIDEKIPVEQGTGTNSVQQKGTGAVAMSEASVAIGVATHSGTKGFRWTSWDKASLTFTLEKTLPKAISNNAWLSVINDSHYDKCCQVDGNVSAGSTTIKVKTSPFDSKVKGDTGYDAYTIIVVDDPTIGDIDLGQTACAEGGNTKALQMFSHAEGYGTQAIGQYSHAEGRETMADYASHAEGRNTSAKGTYAHAEGRGTETENVACHAEGADTKAIGSASHSEGKRTMANGYSSHAEGAVSVTGGDYNSNTLSPLSDSNGAYAHAEGNATIAKGSGAHAEGKKTFASGIASHSEGQETVANNRAAHAEGLGTNSTTIDDRVSGAFGIASHSEGVRTLAKGQAAHSEGQETKAIGGASHAEGYMTTANERRSHAEGSTTTALGIASHAEGNHTIASRDYSHTEGSDTEARGLGSHAEGQGTIAKNFAEHAEGLYNKSNIESDVYGAAGNTQHSVGIGTSTADTKNAFEIMQNGDVYIIGLGGYDGTNAGVTGVKTLQQIISDLQNQ